MTRQQRRAADRAEAKAKRAATISAAMDYLVNAAGPTATGATIIMPDGELVYVSVEQARQMATVDASERPQ
jgi:hypothetical protein